jgi:RimJ/RimL family protein N-acetyltransferase
MRKLILDDKLRVNEWIWHRVGRETPFHPPSKYQAVGVEKDGELIGGVVFSDFTTGVRCTMHCAGLGKKWLTKELLSVCFDYAFNIAKLKVIVNIVKASNIESVEFTKHVGFTEACRIKDGASDGDLVILVLHRDNCRWIGA